MREFAPHLLEQAKNKSKQLNNGDSTSSAINKELEVVKIIQQFYQQQCSEDPLKLFNQNFYSQIGI